MASKRKSKKKQSQQTILWIVAVVLVLFVGLIIGSRVLNGSGGAG